MNFEQIIKQFYAGMTVEELEPYVAELAAEKASELEGPNSPEYDRLTEKFYEEMMEELNSPWG